MMRFASVSTLIPAAMFVAVFNSPAVAVPYASAVRNTSGSSWEFVLNETADTVTITRDGGNAIVMNNPAAGRISFDLESFSTFEIQVAKDTAAGWTELSQRSNLFTHYFRPNGVAVNKDPSSPYFGTAYIVHPYALTDPSGNYGFDPRTYGDGVYALTADLIGVDLANNFAVVTDVNDATQAKAPAGWTVDQSIATSPWRIALDDSGNVLVSDWSDQSGGIKYASPNLSTGGLVLEHEDGVLPLLLDDATQTHEIHGSIVSQPIVRGSVGVDLTVWGIDEDFDLDFDTFTDPDGDGPIPAAQFFNSLWRWDVGAATEYDQPPALEVSSVALGVGETKWYSTIHSVQADAYYDPRFDKFYLTQSRTHGNQSSLVIVTADGVDGTTPTIEWSSREWTLANGLDGAIPTANTPVDTLPEVAGLQDIFRSVGSVTISPDGKWLFAHRSEQFNDQSLDGDNPILGEASNNPGSILVIPLDANGLPVIEVDDNGTPGDPSDDFVTNLQSITIVGQLGRHVRNPVDTDAAGNVYITNNISELLQVFSPGGNTLATTTSAGTFSLQTIGEGLIGDYNENGIVDAADFTAWRDRLGQNVALPNEDPDATPGMVTIEDYNVWKSAFGNSGSGGGALAGAAVPEPAAGLLLILGAACGLFAQRRR